MFLKIGIIGPCDFEIEPFIAEMSNVKLEDHAMLKFHLGRYSNIDIVAVRCGICKVNAAIASQVLIDRYNVDQIIVTGVAGAIDEDLKIFDTVICSEVAYHDVSDEILTKYHPKLEGLYFRSDENLTCKIISANAGDDSVSTGKIVTGEVFITEDGREQIIEKYNPMCVDMETGSIAHVCHVNQVPFAAIRSMSDSPQESGEEVFAKYCRDAALKSIKVLKRYLDMQ